MFIRDTDRKGRQLYLQADGSRRHNSTQPMPKRRPKKDK